MVTGSLVFGKLKGTKSYMHLKSSILFGNRGIKNYDMCQKNSRLHSWY